MPYDVAPLTAVQVTLALVVVMLLTATPVGVLQGVNVVKLVDAVYALVPLAQTVATCTS